jgi:hypothetical protein
LRQQQQRRQGLPLAAGMLTLQLQTTRLFADTAFHRFVWSAAAEVALTR